MDNEPISRPEHEEFKRRIEAQQNRTDRRLEFLEESTEKMTNLVVAVEKLAIHMGTMASELKEQGAQIKKLEERDGEMWRKVTGYIITAIVGIVIGFVFKQIGI